MFAKLSKKYYLIALSVIILSVAGFAFYKMKYLPAQMPVDTSLLAQNIQTTMVQKGDLVIYAHGTGTLIAHNEIKLGFGTNGPISELNVQVGSEVHTGDLLAVQGDRELLEAAAAADQLSVKLAENALEDINKNAAVVSAQAQLDLANAIAALHTAKYKRSVQQEGRRASKATLTIAQAELKTAKEDLDTAKRELDGNPNNWNLQLDYANAQKAYYSALGNWNWYTGSPTDIQQAQLDAEVALAEARVTQAELAWEVVKDGPNPDEVASAELQIASTEAQLAVSRRNLEASTIVAPMDATILAVTETAGHDVSGKFISLADLSKLYLDIVLDGTDVDKIALDYPVEVIFDALPNQVFTGLVVQIDPSLQTTGSISTVKGMVKLDQTAAIDKLRLGMKATVDVIGGRAEGVTLVPIEALHEQAPGKYAVFIMDGGVQKLRPVEVGLMGSAFVEIKSGINVGEIVITGPGIGS